MLLGTYGHLPNVLESIYMCMRNSLELMGLCPWHAEQLKDSAVLWARGLAKQPGGRPVGTRTKSLLCRSFRAAAALALPSEPGSEREAARDLRPVHQPPLKEACRPGTPWFIVYPVSFEVGLVHTCLAADVHLRFQVQACPSPLGTCEV